MTMPTIQNRRRWWVVPLTMLIGGMGLTAAATAGAGRSSSWVFISGVIFTALATGAFVAIGRTRGDLGAIVASSSDERQRGIDLRATAAAGVAVAVVLLLGSIVTLAQGHSGQPWVDLAAAYGVSYVVFLFIFRST